MIKRPFQMKRDYSAWLLICVVIFAGNIKSIFGLDTIVLDDQMWYYRVAQGEFPFLYLNRLFIAPFIEWMFMNILMISPALARGIYVFLVMMPLSVILFGFYHKHLKLPTTLSLVGSVLPNIIPSQILLPAFINGSATLYGLLFAVSTFWVSINYIENNQKILFHFIVPILIFLSPQVMTQAIFLFPCFTLYFLVQNGSSLRKTLCISYLFATGLYRILWVFMNPFGVINKPVSLNFDQIIDRLNNFFIMTTVIDYEQHIGLLYLGFILLILLSLIVFLRKPHILFPNGLPFEKLQTKYNVIVIYSFLILWMVGTSVVFLTMTKYFPGRYLHLSSFAVNLLLSLIVYSVFAHKYKFIFPVIVSILVIYSVTLRYNNQNINFSARNRDHTIISNNLNKFNIKKDAQIAVLRAGYHTGGYYYWGSGYLQFVLKRSDVSGHLYRELYFYDAFKDYGGYERDKIFRGFTLDKPFYAYLFDRKNKKLIPVEYCLRWLEDKQESHWIIYKLKDGQLLDIMEGNGIHEYSNFVNQNQDIREQIIWGKCPNEEAIKRVGIHEEHLENICDKST